MWNDKTRKGCYLESYPSVGQEVQEKGGQTFLSDLADVRLVMDKETETGLICMQGPTGSSPILAGVTAQN